MKIFYTLLLLFIFSRSYSQIGFKMNYSRASYTNIEERLNRNFEFERNILKNNYEVGVFYRYQVDGTGIELLPGINYRISPKDGFGLSYKRYSFELPFIIYPLNMEGDCGCPDFSIRNKFFEKHLFFILTPSINFETKTLEREEITADFSNLYFKLGVGAGILIPLTERFSIAPAVVFNWAFNDKWSSSILGETELKDISVVYNDLSFELRFNYKFIN